jgi:EAL domain-containing protein (putative c-di-GMP-specific phosphodiesterase class I)
MGAAIVLDDFGTGYSSLSYLWQFSFDKIKIDQSFVRALGEGGNVTDIVAAIITLGRTLKARILAEGVETEEQAELLRGMRCDQVQGYLFSRPLAGDKADELAMAASLAGADLCLPVARRA